MSVSDFLSNEFTFLTGLIVTIAAVAGIFYKGLTWLRAEVTKENKAIREQVVSENKAVRQKLEEENLKIKEDAIERISQNRTDIQNVENTLSKELQYNNTLVSTKLDNIQLASKEYKMQLENYSKDIGKTINRNDSKINDHEIRIALVENKVQTILPIADKSNIIRKRNFNINNNGEDENGNNNGVH